MNPPAPDPRANRNQKDLFRVMTVSTALGFGALASFLYSLKAIPEDPTFVFSPGTVIVFALGSAAGWLFWRVVERKIQQCGDADQDHPSSDEP